MPDHVHMPLSIPPKKRGQSGDRAYPEARPTLPVFPSTFNSSPKPGESLIPLCRNFIDVASYLSKAILAQFPNAIAPDAIGVDQSSSLEGAQVLCDSLPRELGAIG